MAFALGGVLLVVASALGVAIVYRVPLTAALLRYGLGRAGFADARFEIERIDGAGATVTDIDAGERLRIDRLDVTFDFRRLPQLPVERLRVVGARLELPQAPPATETTSEEAAPSPGLPIALLPALELENMRVTVPSPLGTVSLRLDSRVERQDETLHMQLDGSVDSEAGKAALHGEARLDPGGMVSMSVQIPSLRLRRGRWRVGSGSANARFDAESSGLDLRSAKGQIELSLEDVRAGDSTVGNVAATVPLTVSRPNGRWVANLAGADLRLPAKALHLSVISADASSQAADLRVERIEDTATPRRFEPLALHLKLLQAPPAARFSADLTAAGGRATLHADGRYEASAAAAKVDVSMPRLALDPAGLRLTDLSPLLAAAGTAKGALEGTARLRWTARDGIDGTASLVFDHLSLDGSSVRIDDLAGQVDLARLLPLETAGVQSIRIHELHPGVAFADAVVRWGLEPVPAGVASRLRLERFEAGFAGGRVVVRDALLDPLAAQNRLDFRLEEVDVARLFAIASFEGVSGSGRLSGTIPVVVRGNSVAIEKGELAAHGGVLQMRSQKVASLLAGGGQSVELLLDALRDFHYDDLVVTIEKGFTGDATVRLHLAGNNPTVLESHPFRINLNISGNLDRIVGSLLEIARLSDRAVRATVRGVKQELR